MRRYTVELWGARDGDPDRMPDAIITVSINPARVGYGALQSKSEVERALFAAQSRAARAAGSRGVPFVGTRGFEIDWSDWHIIREPQS